MINEPDENQKENLETVIEDEKKFYNEGDIIIYKLRTTKIIEKNEELTW